MSKCLLPLPLAFCAGPQLECSGVLCAGNTAMGRDAGRACTLLGPLSGVWQPGMPATDWGVAGLCDCAAKEPVYENPCAGTRGSAGGQQPEGCLQLECRVLAHALAHWYTQLRSTRGSMPGVSANMRPGPALCTHSVGINTAYSAAAHLLHCGRCEVCERRWKVTYVFVVGVVTPVGAQRGAVSAVSSTQVPAGVVGPECGQWMQDAAGHTRASRGAQSTWRVARPS